MRSFDYVQFRAEFVRKQNSTAFHFAHTAFGQANAAAERSQARQWAAYKPLTYEQLWDDLKPEAVTITSFAVLEDKASGRSTRAGCATFIPQYHALKRPTEYAAVLHARGYLILEGDFPVVRQGPGCDMRVCVRCGRHMDIQRFAVDARFPSRLAFYCPICRAERAGYRWKRQGDLTLARMG